MDNKMLVATLPAEVNLAEWCRRMGISRQTAYKWRRRYAMEGPAGLEDRSRAPQHPAGRSSPDVEEVVVACRKRLADAGLDAGPASIRWHLEHDGLRVPSEATIWRILVRRGQINPQPKKRPRASYRRFQRERPNECWQLDDTHYTLASGQEVRIINIIDDHSRLNVDSLAVINCRSERIWESFCRGVQRYGPPAEVLDDNGLAYISRDGHHPVLFQANLARVGVRQLHSSPYHPQTCGKVECFHQTQRRWLAAHPQARTIAELQKLLDQCRDVYNHSRPHRALGRRTPASVWSAQPAATPATPGPVKARLSTSQADRRGIVSPYHRVDIGLGIEWANQPVHLIRLNDHVTVISSITGEIIRDLTIDPTRYYQPTGRYNTKRRPEV